MPNSEYDFVGSKSARNAVCADIIRNDYSFMNMKRYFPVPDNNSYYSLDLFFSNINFVARETLSTVDDHHTPIIFKAELTIDVVHDKVFPKDEQFNFSQANYERIDSYLSQANWENIFSKSDGIESNLQDFYDTVALPINEFDPTKKFHSPNDSYPRWYTSELVSLIIDKKTPILTK
ncbi:hypothetical protein QAD02_013503 [Eretmocerus hayati]|uniref:Uncharacterized protein n=1 Tax=Eretmocerus hayati TaxID=131215 RepID=A0ACC2P3S6_9HYME|nr:hypothetical protein QAD02_013503 [Eretmocerus hayati]